MRKIQESLNDIRSLSDYINNEPRVDEGLKDILTKVKDTLGNAAKRVVSWAKGVVAQLQNWFMVVNEDGKVLPCSTPLTMGNAWKNGLIDKTSTFIGMGKEAGKIVGTSEPFNNATKMYPDTLSVWRRIASKITESRDEEAFIQSLCESNSNETNQMLNEVRMANQDPQAKYNVICDDAMLAKLIKMHALNKQFSRLMIWGAPGIGKTAILNAVVKEIASEQGKDYSLIVKQLASETPDNFFLPKYTDDGRATDVPKTWMPVYRKTGDAAVDAELDAKCGRGLLFIDELSRATQQVQNVLLPLINEGVLNGWYLGSGWAIICASNRMEDEESGGQTNIGAALGNRFSQVYYEPTCKTWKKWAEKQGFISPLLTQWLDMPAGESLAGGKFFYWDPNEEGDNEDTTHLMCTPRSWTNAMQQLASFHHTGTLEGFNIFDIDEPIVKMILNNNVPAAAVDAFWAFLQTIHRIGNFDDAVKSAWSGDGKGLKIAPKDLVHVALPLAQLVITAHKDKLPTQAEFESLSKWLVSANNEQLASYVLDVFKNVFGTNVPDTDAALGLNDLKSYIFYLKKMNDRKPDVWEHIHVFDAFMKVWGVTRKTMPDYSTGMAIIAKKYGDAFKSAQVDGADGLG